MAVIERLQRIDGPDLASQLGQCRRRVAGGADDEGHRPEGLLREGNEDLGTRASIEAVVAQIAGHADDLELRHLAFEPDRDALADGVPLGPVPLPQELVDDGGAR